MELERLGVPAIIVCTDRFLPLAVAEGKRLGLERLTYVVVPHPIGNADQKDVAAIGVHAVTELEESLQRRRSQPACPSHVDSSVGWSPVAEPSGDVDMWLQDQGWTDGFPVVAPTRERVDQVIRLSPHDADLLVGTLAPRQGQATVSTVAANAVMAGCQPAHFPAVLAAVMAICRPEFNAQSMQTTTGPVAPLSVVSGPQARTIGLVGGNGCLDPTAGPGGVIGRAIRLSLSNIGGASSRNMLDRATQGQPGKFSLCVTENTDECPWPPVHLEWGYALRDTAVLVTGVIGTQNIIDYGSTAAEDLLETLSSGLGNFSSNHVVFGGTSVLVLGPEHAVMLAEAGMTRARVREIIAERAVVDFARTPRNTRATVCRNRAAHLFQHDDAPTQIPAFDGPESIEIVVAGGPGPHSVFFPSYANVMIPQHALLDVALEVGSDRSPPGSEALT